MACCHLYKKEEKKKRKKEDFFFFDIVCDKYMDAFKLGANWNGQYFKNHEN